jgi:hypothetical protein
MVTFLSIFERTGATEMARRIGFPDANTVHAWKRTDSIPAAYWKALAEAGIATLDELAEAAANRRAISRQDAAA